MARKKLILHIGTHKTATTTIQRALGANSSVLGSHGFHYGDWTREPKETRPKHTSLTNALMSKNADLDAEIAAIHDDFERSGQETLILSEECLSAPRFGRLRQIEPLTAKYDTEIVVYFRRQDMFVESLWNQFSRERNRLEPRPIAEFARAEDTRGRLAYHRIADFWSRFGTVRAFGFDDHKADVFAPFTRELGLPEIEKERDRNLSPSMNAAAMVNILNRHGHDFRMPHVLRGFKDDRQKYALGRQLRDEILADCAPGNADLAERYGVRFNDDRPEGEADEPLVYPSEEALADAIKYLNSIAVEKTAGKERSRPGSKKPLSRLRQSARSRGVL